VDHHFAPIDNADSGNLPCAMHLTIVFTVRSQGGDFQERRARIQQQIETLANGELIAAPQTVNITRRPIEARLVLHGLKFPDACRHGGIVCLVFG
jgi:hypothetical protein